MNFDLLRSFINENVCDFATTDTVSTVGGLAATGITIAAVASVPMLPIIATGALVTGLGCAAYSVGRSTFRLVRSDRRNERILKIFSELGGPIET